ncbi:hypothetical protein M0Q97_07455 [Candidatus Dojkabacteria bacterium]|jgi:amino acid transporter|nr:hypothetical protein [Candidatus Dojkabacteria bacterium]
MKKVLILLVFFFVGYVTYSQTLNINKDGVSVKLETDVKDSTFKDNIFAEADSGYVTNTNIEKLIDKYGSKVSAAIVAIAKELKQPVEHVYVILVRQQIVKSIANLFLIIVTIVISYISIKSMTNPKAEWESGNVYSIGGVLLAILSVIILIISLFHFNEMITGFVNPEYGALSDIIGFIK